VDALLNELDHDQYVEWCQFFGGEPHGWQAMRIATTRLAYVVAQSQSRRRLKERDFDLRLDREQHGPSVEKARYEAMSVRTTMAG
jgi:hypothetical protein